MALVGVKRRSLLGGAVAVCGAAMAGGSMAAVPTADATAEMCSPLGAVTVVPGDPRYRDLTTRGFNGRFIGRPESVRVVGSAEQVVEVVDEAARDMRRIAVRGGGHCFENFVDDPAVRILIDTSEMKAVYFDPHHQAFAVEAGATLGQLYRTLYLGWGVTVPGGACPSVGVGGHFAGGGYGSLSRKYGLVADHLYGVEIVVVDQFGRARRVVATRKLSDPSRDLWWAHTGGGGGNFGIVTRYLLRSPDARNGDPETLLPKPPGTLRYCSITYQWQDMTEKAFVRFVRNYGAWHERDSRGDSPYVGLSGGLTLNHRESGQQIMVEAELDDALPNAGRLLDSYIAALTKDVGVPYRAEQSTTPWLKSALYGYRWAGGSEFKSKSALQRKPWSDRQIAIIYKFLNEGGGERWGTMVYLSLFGGKTNTVAPSATAMAHRDAIFMAVYETVWGDPEGREQQLEWIRRFYRDLYSDTGGVPVPNAANGGVYINYPDVDLADPRWNTSGIAWHTLCYRDNYRRLQQIKTRWNPRDILHHDLSIRPPG